MADSNPSRFLTNSTDRDLALKMFAGDVLLAYRLETVFDNNTGNIIAKKAIASGKSWQWPILGNDPAPEYHIPGTELLGQIQTFNEITVTIDDILVGHRDIPLDQLSISHYDVIQPYATAIGRAMAIFRDGLFARMGVIAARTAALTGYHSGGNVVSRYTAAGTAMVSSYPNSSTGASQFLDDSAALAQLLDEDNIPRSGRNMFIPPAILRVLGYDTGLKLFSKDFIAGGNNANERIVTRVQGFDVYVSNNMPSTNFAGGGPPSNPTKYDVDCRYPTSSVGTVSVLGQPAAIVLCGADVGTPAIVMVESIGFTHVLEADNRRNTLFMKSQQMFGLGVVSPWAAGLIQCGASS